MNKVRSEDKRSPLSSDSLIQQNHASVNNCEGQQSLAQAYFEVLDIAKKMSKIDVKEVAWRGHHDVVVMTISNTL